MSCSRPLWDLRKNLEHPLMRGWHFSCFSPTACLSLPWGCCTRGFSLSVEMSVKRRTMISLLFVKLQSRFGNSLGGKENVITREDETSKEGRDGRCSIWTCLPLRSSKLESELLPSHSTLYLAVVDLSPTSHPPYCECRRQIEGFSRCKA